MDSQTAAEKAFAKCKSRSDPKNQAVAPYIAEQLLKASGLCGQELADAAWDARVALAAMYDTTPKHEKLTTPQAKAQAKPQAEPQAEQPQEGLDSEQPK